MQDVFLQTVTRGLKNAVLAIKSQPHGCIQNPILFKRGKATSLEPT